MTGTALESPKVRTYLRELDAALVLLPRKQARELKEQITAHLDESLPLGAGDDEVMAVLDHLGSVREVVAAAAGATPVPLGRRVWARLRASSPRPEEFDDTYRQLRPMIERTIAWLVRGTNRKLRYRGVERNRLWLSHRAAVINLMRLVNLGLVHDGTSWSIATA